MQPLSAVLASFLGRVTPLPPLLLSEVKWFRCVSVWLPWNVPQVGRLAEGRPPDLAACARGQKSKDNSKGNGFSPKFWADRAGEGDTFALIYRRLSSCAHGALHPLDYYMDDGIGDDLPVVQIGNMHAELAPQLLQISSSVVLGLMGFLAPDTPVPEPLVDRVKAYDVLLRVLAEKTPPA